MIAHGLRRYLRRYLLLLVTSDWLLLPLSLHLYNDTSVSRAQAGATSTYRC